MCIDIKSMYLSTPMDRFKYIRLPMQLIPETFSKKYNLHDKLKNGFVYMKIEKGMYVLPKAGILANKLLRKQIAPHGS